MLEPRPLDLVNAVTVARVGNGKTPDLGTDHRMQPVELDRGEVFGSIHHVQPCSAIKTLRLMASPKTESVRTLSTTTRSRYKINRTKYWIASQVSFVIRCYSCQGVAQLLFSPL